MCHHRLIIKYKQIRSTCAHARQYKYVPVARIGAVVCFLFLIFSFVYVLFSKTSLIIRRIVVQEKYALDIIKIGASVKPLSTDIK